MNKSESIKDLAAALAKAQGEFEAVKRDCENPFFKSSYADLASVVAATKPTLAKHGLSVTQLLSLGSKGPIVTTILMHSSGEWIASDLEVPSVKVDAQGIGSAATYGRRYSLSAILGVASEEDDDGNAATHNKPDSRRAGREGAVATTSSRQAAAPKHPQDTPGPQPDASCITPNMAKRFFAIAKQNNWTDFQIKELLLGYGYEHSKEIRNQDYNQLVGMVSVPAKTLITEAETQVSA